MQVFAFVAGTLACVLFTIIRAIFGGRQVGLSNKSLKDVFGIPSKGDYGGILTATGQIMGILWIVVGFVLMKLEDWDSLKFRGGNVLELFLVLSPILIYQGVMWRLKKSQENKN